MAESSSDRRPGDDPMPAAPGPGSREATVAGEPSRIKRLGKLLGPGLISGVSDDDPATIGTCASIGSSIGFRLLWTMLATIPLMAGVQYMAAKIGQVTGLGLGAVIRKHYPRVVMYPLLMGVIVANAINAGTDLGAMAAGINLIFPGIPIGAIILPLAAAIVFVQIWGNYRLIERIFKWLTLSLFAYIGAALMARPDLRTVLWGTFVPTLRLDKDCLAALVAISGTTFSPYLYYWQSSQEVEEKVAMGRRRLEQRRGTTHTELRLTAWDVNIGMVASNVVTYFVILTAAATLYQNKEGEVQTADQLARTLEPVAGPAAAWLLALGLLGTGLLAVPILTTSAAYAASETFRWRRGLDAPPARARNFYGMIVIATLIGMEINYLGISPVAALFWTSVIYGFIAPPLLLILLLISNSRKIMGEHANGTGLKALGWLAVLASTAAAVGFVLTSWW